MNKNIVIGILLTALVLLGLYSFSDSSLNISTSVSGFSEDSYKFYKNVTSYMSLLSEEDAEIVQDRIDKVSENLDKEDSDLAKAILAVYVQELNKDEKTKSILKDLRDTVDSLKKDKMNQEDSFSKNTECAKLSSNIKSELKNKYSNGLYSTETEELDFIFYSPTYNACLYTTSYSYSYSDYSSSEYYSRSSYKVYNVTSNSQIGDYVTYYSTDYPYISVNEKDERTKQNKRDYAKFILENSGYNADLLTNKLYY